MRTICLCLALATTAAQGAQPPTTAPSTQPQSAQAVLDQMLQPRSATAHPLSATGSPRMDNTGGAGAVAPGAPLVRLKREGDYVVNRLGRLTRSEDGRQAQFSFEADGQGLQDPPVILLANLKLMLMEDAAKSSSRPLRFLITGILTEYQGRNYLLLEKVVVAPDVADPMK